MYTPWGFFTNFIQIRSADATLYKAMQDFNQVIFKGAIGLIIGTLILYVSEVHKMESNGLYTKIISVINGLCGLAFSFYMIRLIPEFKTDYLAIIVEDIQIYFEKYTLNTFTFEVGMLLAYVFAGVSIMMILSIFIKNNED